MVSSFSGIGCSKENQWTTATCDYEGNSKLYTKQGKKQVIGENVQSSKIGKTKQ